ncbi:Putative purine nucleoside phosphorylase Short=PNP; AltName: Full=Inosine phosphorylase; AltName: Full=Inosine-guanosine phosphorylase [Serendipita indica DSM 11827]|nr:Putative purine nucleoside phosphorylase Short=PNP; AltName: Full=Inosine phosphorylase; AltName: Full=Inosine-guanosine phosphorylase [Serendipita indica DSM 11827]
MLGRFHVYEGHSPHQVTFPVRLFARLGCRNIILTNAAGSLNPRIPAGTIVAIHDHISLPSMTGLNPLYGPTSTSTHSPRFLPLSNAYSRTLRKYLFHASMQLNLPPETLVEGTYCWVTGPTYETAAEGRWLREIGGDVVGASTVPEVMAARDEGMDVLVLSLVTNAVVIPIGEKQGVKKEVERELAGMKYGDSDEKVVSHDEVLAMGIYKAEVVKQLVMSVVQMIV